MLNKELLSAISTIGFPVLVAMYVLVRREATIAANTVAVIQLQAAVEAMARASGS